jgi:hypothetical protein
MRTLEEARAIRKDGIIYIFMTGILPTPCHEIKVINKYPGGTIMYIKDPGAAELFIEMGLKPDLEGDYCIQVTLPFFLEEEIPDSGHDEVIIYVNGEINKRIKVEEQFEQDSTLKKG